jgi:hypothetical protein
VSRDAIIGLLALPFAITGYACFAIVDVLNELAE